MNLTQDERKSSECLIPLFSYRDPITTLTASGTGDTLYLGTSTQLLKVSFVCSSIRARYEPSIPKMVFKVDLDVVQDLPRHYPSYRKNDKQIYVKKIEIHVKANVLFVLYGHRLAQYDASTLKFQRFLFDEQHEISTFTSSYSSGRIILAFTETRYIQHNIYNTCFYHCFARTIYLYMSCVRYNMHNIYIYI